MSGTIEPKDFTKVMNELLDEYGADVLSVTVSAADDTSKQARNELRKMSSGGFNDVTGRYRRGWRASLKKSTLSVEATVYNETDYRLTHLLENGHVVKNQYGETGASAKAFPHISEVNDWAIEQFESKLAEGIEKLNR